MYTCFNLISHKFREMVGEYVYASFLEGDDCFPRKSALEKPDFYLPPPNQGTEGNEQLIQF